MAEGREKEYDAIVDNVSKFVMFELRTDFPEINGFGIGIKIDEFQGRNLNPVSQEEAYQKLGFLILLEKEVSEERTQKIKMRIADKLLKFMVVGRIEPL